MKRIILTILAVSVWVFGLNGQVMDILTAPNEITPRALVIAISEYQDGAIRKNEAARPNAELMGAFLRTPEGGMIPAGHLHLLVDKQATMARMLSALEWIESECNPGDHLMLYFSGYAQMVQIEDKTKPYLFFYDSPKCFLHLVMFS